MPQLDFADSMRALDEGWGLVPLGDRWLTLSGADHLAWLQGQITNDIRQLDQDRPLKFGLCSPTGALEGLYTGYLESTGETVVIGDPVSIDLLKNRIETHVILEDITCFVPSPGAQLWSVQGTHWRDCEVESPWPNDRGGRGGADFVMAEVEEAEWPILDPVAFEIAQLEAGVPQFGIDTGSKTILPELGPRIDAMYVSYTKGCYTGQEILHRIFSRGGTKTRWVGLKTEKLIEPGAYDGVWVTRSAESPRFGSIAAAHVKREFAVSGTILEVNGISAKVQEMPFIFAS